MPSNPSTLSAGETPKAQPPSALFPFLFFFLFMTEHQIEQVTPRIHPTSRNQITRTWQQPKIRLHNAIQPAPSTVKEILPSYHFRSTRVRVATPSKNDVHAISPLLKTTPVTHPTIPKPLRFRIAGAQPDHDTICRRLFPTTTPAKRPRNSTPSFRFSCGRERTQPSPDRNTNALVDALDAHIDQAQKNLRIFQNGLSTNHPNNAFQTAINEGLLFDVFCSNGNLLILAPFAHQPDQQRAKTLLVTTLEMLAEQTSNGASVDYSGCSVYIPHPWYAQVVNGWNSNSPRVLIAAHKMEIFRKEQLTPFANLTVNAAHDRLPLLAVSATEAESLPPGTISSFAALSPHVVTMNLSIFVEFYDPDLQLAIMKDDNGDLAFLVTKNPALQVSSRKQFLSDVLILPHRVQSREFLDALRDQADKRNCMKRFINETDSYFAFKHGENFELRTL